MRIWATVFALWALAPRGAWAQNETTKKNPPPSDSGFGLDLTQDASNAQDKVPSGGDKAAEKGGETGASAISDFRPPPAEPPLTERDITREDRVKSVQRKVYLKRHRFELAPFISVSL